MRTSRIDVLRATDENFKLLELHLYKTIKTDLDVFKALIEKQRKRISRLEQQVKTLLEDK